MGKCVKYLIIVILLSLFLTNCGNNYCEENRFLVIDKIITPETFEFRKYLYHYKEKYLIIVQRSNSKYAYQVEKEEYDTIEINDYFNIRNKNYKYWIYDIRKGY